ncbi:MAG: EFR1 family ferrodoxin [Actinomycetota bacterium]|jgi:ferredoxin|nr:EFR1 family ferrodoxin [Actinomycetota bacterium]
MRIFYFSGTGNSFYVAKRIADDVASSEVTSIPAFLGSGETTIGDNEIVIVSPVYFYSLPHAVVRFIEAARLEDVRYLSVVLTAEFPNGLALGQTVKLMRAKGLEPNSLFYVKMPTNYLIKSKMLTDATIDDVLAAADRKIDRIASVISDRRSSRERDSWAYSLITRAASYQAQWERNFPRFDSGFSSGDSCNACGSCERDCPFGNITVDDRPRWSGHCEACLRCINTCPKDAIQYGDSTEGRRRYFNPRVSMKELK